MLFRLLKGYARLAIKFYCRRVIVNKPGMLHADGPLLLAANHPNSFLDGIIMTTLFERPVHSLARGDAFSNPRWERVLRWMRLLPVYRTSEGVENLGHNYTTFAACREVFAQNGIVIIFSEGRCVNEWKVRPLKKGTARLATATWNEGIPLKVVPVGFNYNSFRNFGKNVFINFGEPMDAQVVLVQDSYGKQLLQFNSQLEAQLKKLVFHIDKNDATGKEKLLTVPQPLWFRLLFALPAVTGWLLHAPLYYGAKAATLKWFNNDHFDSVMVAMLVLAYPLYLLLLLLIAASIWGGVAAWAGLLIVPLTALCLVQLKQQV